MASPAACGLEFGVTLAVDLITSAFEHIVGCDVADGRVQALVVVEVDVVADYAPGVFKRKRYVAANGLLLEARLIALDLAV